MIPHDVQQLQLQVRKQTQEFPGLVLKTEIRGFFEILKKYFPEGYNSMDTKEPKLLYIMLKDLPLANHRF